MQKTDMTFWEHLDVLRNSLIKIVLAVVICGSLIRHILIPYIR